MVFAFGAVSATALTFGSLVSAYGGNETAVQKRLFHPEQHAAMEQAIESGDYAAFREMVPEEMGEMITADNFDQFVKMHALMKDGDREGAQALAEELGLPQRHGMMKKYGEAFTPEMREAMNMAFENVDYDAWKALVGDKNVGESITADTFPQFVQMHQLLQAGDREGAQALAEELGFPERPAMKHRMMKGFHHSGAIPPVEQAT